MLGSAEVADRERLSMFCAAVAECVAAAHADLTHERHRLRTNAVAGELANRGIVEVGNEHVEFVGSIDELAAAAEQDPQGEGAQVAEDNAEGE